jgi:drug/metabolite transporter (DMT)-like permease
MYSKYIMYQIIFISIIILLKAIKPYLKTSISNINLMIATSFLTIILLSIYLFYKNDNIIWNSLIELTPKDKLIIFLITSFNIITTLSINKLYENNSISNINLIIKSLSTISPIIIGYLFFNDVFTYKKLYGIGFIVIGMYFLNK